ncbi:MAG: hypothetical protein ACOX8B_01530 [Lachnospiraceae bacterium]|jgi:hypothetical protein
MYKLNHVIRLDQKEFYDVSVWNLYCRTGMYSFLVLAVLALGLGSIASAMPALKRGDTNQFILNAGIGAIIVFVEIYMCWKRVDQFKRESRNEEQLAKTEKHIKMDDDQIINYRSSIDEQVIYKWAQVDAMYDRPNEYIMSMKDKQMLIFVKAKLQPEEAAFLKQKGDELKLWKKDVPKVLLEVLLAVIIISCVAFGVMNYIAA